MTKQGENFYDVGHGYALDVEQGILEDEVQETFDHLASGIMRSKQTSGGRIVLEISPDMILYTQGFMAGTAERGGLVLAMQGPEEGVFVFKAIDEKNPMKAEEGKPVWEVEVKLRKPKWETMELHGWEFHKGCEHVQKIREVLVAEGVEIWSESDSEPPGWVNVWCEKCQCTFETVLALGRLESDE